MFFGAIFARPLFFLQPRERLDVRAGELLALNLTVLELLLLQLSIRFRSHSLDRLFLVYLCLHLHLHLLGVSDRFVGIIVVMLLFA